MKKKEKRMILILLVVLVIAVVIFVISKNKTGNKENTEENNVVEEFVQVLEDGTRLNTSTKLNEMKKFEGLEFILEQSTIQKKRQMNWWKKLKRMLLLMQILQVQELFLQILQVVPMTRILVILSGFIQKLIQDEQAIRFAE